MDPERLGEAVGYLASSPRQVDTAPEGRRGEMIGLPPL